MPYLTTWDLWRLSGGLKSGNKFVFHAASLGTCEKPLPGEVDGGQYLLCCEEPLRCNHCHSDA